MIPKLLVPMMKGFGCEKLAGFCNGTIRECPVMPEGEMNTVQSEINLGLLDVQLEVPQINLLSEAFNLGEGDGH